MKLKLSDKEFEFRKVTGQTYIAEIGDRNLVRDAVKVLLQSELAPLYFQALTAVDEPDKKRIELYYCFWSIRKKSNIILAFYVERENPQIPSISDIVPGAKPYEQEVYDLLGVRFTGNQFLREAFLKPEDMKGTYPLRKEKQR